MRRRNLLKSGWSCGPVGLPLGQLRAQQPGRLPKVAILDPGTPDYAERPVSRVHDLLQRR